MLLALDVGNTNITIGTFEGTVLKGRWRLRTIKEQTADEWGILLRNLFTLSSLELSAVDGVIISSVVPAVDQPLEAMAERYFGRRPMFINPLGRSGNSNPLRQPQRSWRGPAGECGGGVFKIRRACVVVDLGTTINFDIVGGDGTFLGGSDLSWNRNVDFRSICPHCSSAHGGFSGA